MKKSIHFILLAACFVAVSCANEADPTADKSYFTRIYDNNQFNLSFTPLDVAQTSDGGYLILGTKQVLKTEIVDGKTETTRESNIYILKVDEFGDVVSETDVDKDLVIPAPTLLEVSGKIYFFCMSTSGFTNQIVEVNENGTIGTQANVTGVYPAAAAVDGTNLVLLHYDNNAMEFVISRTTTAGGDPTSKKAFSIGVGEGVEGPIMDGFTGSRTQFPYQVGKASNGLYFFNGFYNYTLSVVFTDLNADDPIGVIQGNQEDGGLSSILPVAGKFAAARFNFGDNYFLPAATLSLTGNSSSAGLGGYAMPELTENAPVVLLNMPINAKERILYASNTKGKQIALFGYDAATGVLAGSRYLGFSNTFEVAAMTPTKDNGLLIVGTTYIAGRFPRICLFKLSPEALAKSFQ